MKSKYFKNLSNMRVMINDIKMIIEPQSVSTPLEEDELKSKDAKKFMFCSPAKLQIVELEDADAIKIREAASARDQARVDFVNQSYLKSVTSRKPKSRNAQPDALSQMMSQNVPGVGIQDVAPPDAGGIVLGGQAPGQGEAVSIPQAAEKVDEEMQATMQAMKQRSDARQDDKDIEVPDNDEADAVTSEGKSIDSIENEDQIEDDGTDTDSSETKPKKRTRKSRAKKTSKKTKAKARKKVKNETDTDTDEMTPAKFGKLPFFTKKATVNKLENKALIKKLIKAESNETVISLLEQRLEEL